MKKFHDKILSLGTKKNHSKRLFLGVHTNFYNTILTFKHKKHEKKRLFLPIIKFSDKILPLNPKKIMGKYFLTHEKVS